MLRSSALARAALFVAFCACAASLAAALSPGENAVMYNYATLREFKHSATYSLFQRAGMTPVLRDFWEYTRASTILSPTDAAWSSLPPATITALLNNGAYAMAVCKSHILPTALLLPQVVRSRPGTGWRTMQGGVVVKYPGNRLGGRGIVLGQAAVIVQNNFCSNGLWTYCPYPGNWRNLCGQCRRCPRGIKGPNCCVCAVTPTPIVVLHGINKVILAR